MFPTELRLESLKHCYVYLPETYTSKLNSLKPGAIISIRSIHDDKELIVMWNGQISSGNYIQLDLNFAKTNQFNEEPVVINLYTNVEPKECSVCKVELLNNNDYSIIVEHLDIELLDTCKLIRKNLVITLWPSQHVSVPVKVVDTQPDNEICLLTKWTHLHIERSSIELPKDRVVEELDSIINNPIPLVSSSLGLGYEPKFSLGSLLICGERGSGKTHLLKEILEDYKKFHSKLFNCQQLRGKRPENVRKNLNEVLHDALNNQPSIIAFDDIDAIVSNDTELEEEKGQEVIYKCRLLDYFCYTLKQLERSNHERGRNVMIIATARSKDNLHPTICSNKGRSYFNQVIVIENPTLQDRIKILKCIINEHNQITTDLNDNQLEDISRRTDGFMPLDLRRLVERSIINACSRSFLDFSSDPIRINFQDFANSICDYTPSNLRGVALQPKTSRTFEQVGGMKSIKEALLNTILLQVKYPKLFKKFPMKTQTSILLYGPPGCGKTIIAEALSNQECINSICVKGPELLSKYIGASEAAVRDLFKRAELAKPCVIFFDEFESLVSKRGADSTGVTDRIVNQFLTILDGVERLSNNIFIIAATSRPDMIDPAMLRPGRLDKHIYCPVPDQKDRLDILKVLSRNIDLVNANESFLEKWSHKLECFTGADIEAFLYSAQLKALHELVDSKSINGNMAEIKIEVKSSHLDQSYSEMEAEVKIRYKNLLYQYPERIGGNKGQAASRATLA